MPERQVISYIPPVVLTLFALINVARGSIHLFAEDGGASSIAGLDLTTNTQTILALFAVIGANQLMFGLFQIWILLQRRDLVLLMLSLQGLQTLGAVANTHFYRQFPVEIPGKMFNTLLLFVIAATLTIAWTESRRNSYR